jgi:3-oxoacyl-[acyl-carrier-protein] synthase-3
VVTALLERIGTYVPATSVSVPELRTRLSLTDAQVRLFTKFFGLDRIAVAPGVSEEDMLLAAAGQALRGVDRSSVRHVVHAYTLLRVAPGTTRLADRVREALDLRHASAFSVAQQNCASGLLAVRLAGALLATEPPGSRTLVLMGEKAFSPQVQLIPGTTIMGEAAVACLVGRPADGRPGDELIGASFRTLGQFWSGDTDAPDVVAEFQRVYTDTLAGVLTAAVRDAGRRVGDVALVLPHNVNKLSWRRVAATAGIELDRVFLDNVCRLGHCYCADPFLNLADARAAGRVRPGDVVVLATVGLGATFAALVLRAGAAPVDRFLPGGRHVA